MLSCLVDGELSDVVPASDRGLAYGDGVFETLAVRGGAPGLWQAHMDRLGRGCERLGLPTPAQAGLLREVKTVAAGQPRCVVKIILTRGSAGRGYAPPESVQPLRMVSAHPWPERIREDQQSGVEAVVCATRLALQPALRGIKHLNRLEQVLAAAELAGHPGKHGVMLNTEGYVIAGVSANLFAVADGQLLTPRMDRCGVHGVLRDLLLRHHAGRCERRRISLELLEEADEVFFCSAIRGIVPVRAIDEHRWPVGPVTRELQVWHQGLAERS